MLYTKFIFPFCEVRMSLSGLCGPAWTKERELDWAAIKEDGMTGRMCIGEFRTVFPVCCAWPRGHLTPSSKLCQTAEFLNCEQRCKRAATSRNWGVPDQAWATFIMQIKYVIYRFVIKEFLYQYIRWWGWRESQSIKDWLNFSTGITFGD